MGGTATMPELQENGGSLFVNAIDDLFPGLGLFGAIDSWGLLPTDALTGDDRGFAED